MTRFAASAAIPRVELDGEVVMFNPLSWETHVLNEAAAAVFDLLNESPCTTEEVTEFLAGALQATEQPRAREHAEAVLRELASLALIREVEHAVGAAV